MKLKNNGPGYRYGILPGSSCQNCAYRREIYKTIPQDCLECGWLKERNAPYSGLMPIWPEGTRSPIPPEILKASSDDCNRLAMKYPDLTPEQFKELLGEKGTLL